MTGEDAIEFMMAGAKCVSVGSANLIDPSASLKIIDGIEDFMKSHNIDDINSIIDTVQMN
jgi:dihydroorotate dehydrogenase (NAD+) catalytic subunit